MSTITSGEMPVRGQAGGRGANEATARRASYALVAGSPRRVRERRRAVALLVASLAVLVPIGLQIHRAAAESTPAVQSFTTGTTVPRQQGDAQVIDNPQSAQRPPEPGAIDPSLSRALGKARAAARTAGLDLQVTSGFRSSATQQGLYDQAIAKYGSAERARLWVLPPAESGHVKGLAVDVGPRAAAAWLEEHGVRYGLCRRYVNEWWHFERLAPAIGQQCPAMEPYAGG